MTRKSRIRIDFVKGKVGQADQLRTTRKIRWSSKAAS